MKPNRSIYLTLLITPAIAMTVALILIISLAKSNTTTVVLVIGLLLIQYLGLVAYIWNKHLRP